MTYVYDPHTSRYYIGDHVKFKNDYGLLMEGQILDHTDVAARIWTHIGIYLINKENIIKKIPPPKK